MRVICRTALILALIFPKLSLAQSFGVDDSDLDQGNSAAEGTPTQGKSSTGNLPLDNFEGSEEYGNYNYGGDSKENTYDSGNSAINFGESDYSEPSDTNGANAPVEAGSIPSALPAESPLIESEEASPLLPEADAGESTDGPVVPEIEVKENDFAGAPPVAGTRRIMAEGEAPFEYLVQPGDTLYDICDQLIDEPTYWPKLWAINPSLKNPHFIYPGMRIHFYPGNEEAPPFMEIVSEDDVIPVDTAGLDEKELITQDLSGLLFESQGAFTTEVVDGNQVSVGDAFTDGVDQWGTINRPTTTQVMLPALFFEDKVDEIAEIVAGANGSFLMRDEDQVYLEYDEQPQSGGTYTVLRYSGAVDAPAEGDFVGYRYEFVGHIKIGNVIDEDYAEATALITRIGIQPGDLVVPFQSVKRSVSLTREAGTTGSGNEVIGFEYPTKWIAGGGDIVMLEQLDGRAMPVGGVYTIINQPEEIDYMFVDSIPPIADRIATVRIIESAGKIAYGYVINSSKEIRLGDRT